MLHYGAGIETLDFQGEPDASRVIINDFVQDFTRDKIKDLLPQGSIKRDTVAVLTNALYFKALGQCFRHVCNLKPNLHQP